MTASLRREEEAEAAAHKDEAQDTAPGWGEVPAEDVVPEVRDEGPHEGDGDHGPVGVPGMHPLRRAARDKAEADEKGHELNVEFIGQSVRYVGGYGGAETIEGAARTCTQTSGIGKAAEFVRNLVRRGHMSPLEFGCADFLLEVDRAIQQEYTRHRHFGFNIESTRWVDYRKKPMRFVTKPPEGMAVPDEAIRLMEEWCELCALVYEAELALGAPRDYARKALVLALASRMRMIGNLRAWLEMIPKRLNPAAHAEAREVAGMLLASLVGHFAGVFDHIGAQVDG